VNSQNRYSRLSIASVAFGIVFACAALLSSHSASSRPADRLPGGLEPHWSHRHVVFSNPGTYREAIENGSSEKWVGINNDPRFIMQRMKRNADASRSRSQETSAAPVSEWRARARKKKQLAPLSRDWSVSLGAAGVAAGQYPAKFTFAPILTPSCITDFAAYGVNAAGASGAQANIVGFISLYVNSLGTGLCPGMAPAVYFSYFVGTGTVQTSPSLSKSGTKIAYIETVSGDSMLHVTTIGTTGSNGTSATSPVAPGTGNNAADTAIILNGGVTISVSSPFVDYTNDIAYVGDDGGLLHKFTPVFNDAPAEVIDGVWPVTVDSGQVLTGPVWDSGTSNVYVGDSAGILSSVSASGTVTSSAALAAGAGIVDAPLVDSSAQKVYVFVADNADGTASAVVQFDISSGNIGGATGTAKTLGTSDTTTPLYIGMFDNKYFTSANPSSPTGTLYTCGNIGGNPTLYQIPITANAMGTPVAGPVLANAVEAGCSPVSENFNSPDDWIFVSVPANSCGATSGVTDGGCLMSFNVGSGAPTIGPWLPSTDYAVNARVVDTNGNIQKVFTAGTSDTSAPVWSKSGYTDDGLITNPDVTSVSQLAAVVTLTNSTGSAIPFSTSNSSDVTMSPSTGTLGAGAMGTITLISTDPTLPAAVTVGDITYNFVSTVPPTQKPPAGGTPTSPNVYEHFGNNGPGNPTAEAKNLYAAITGVTSNCNSSTPNCFSPAGDVVWLFQSASNGQTTAAQATGTGGIIIDNSSVSPGTSNIYFGTLSGTGTTNSAVKMTQMGLK
jgi:hypothetical protein